MIISLDTEKAFDKNLTTLHVKGIRDIRDTRHIPKHKQSSVQQANRQYQTKWRKT